jgi:hypothetical protein
MKKSIYMALCASTLLNAAAPALLPVEKRTFSQSQFIPDISMILDTSFASRNKKQDELSGLVIPGLNEDFYGQEEGDEHGHSHSAYGSDNGFNFNYAELVMSANVDPNFSLDTVFHFDVDGVEVEEAYFTNATALDGLRIRGGKLLSEFGRLNQQHHHFWDFNNMPLVYKSFVGGEGLNELGLQLQYTLPFEEYVMVGAEVLQGENEKSFGYDGFTLSNSVDSVDIESAEAPSLFVGYLKGSFDIGDTSLLPGVSYIYGESKSVHDHEGHQVGFDGTSSIINAELTVKHFFDSYSFLTWQTEWMYMEKKGDEYHLETDTDPIEKEDQKIKQAGYYTQLVYAYDQNWRMGARYESIYQNDYQFTEEALPSAPYKAYSAMVEYHWSEFSRLRLEYTQNEALYTEGAGGFESVDVNTLMLSLNVSIGAHAAHDF